MSAAHTPGQGYGIKCACGRPKARNNFKCRWCLAGIPRKSGATIAKVSVPPPPMWHEAELRLGPQEVVFRFGTEAEASRFYAASAAIAKATGGAQ